MQMVDGRPVYSATDLVAHLACEHLTSLERARLNGLAPTPRIKDRELEVLRKRGFEHEQRYLAELRAQFRTVFEVHRDDELADSGERLRQEAEATRAAMVAGQDVIHQATFFDETWVGHADFLIRVDTPERPSHFGPYHYEVADTKLARHVKAGALLQICSYVDHVERIQGVLPERMHVVLGGNPQRTESFRVDDYMAYFRMARKRFDSAVGPSAPAPIYPLPIVPEPVEHCEVCSWALDCKKRREATDHLSLVAGISSAQRRELCDRGVTTLAELAVLPIPIDPKPRRTSPAALERVREQARLQLEGRIEGKKLHELLEPITPNIGLASLPPPSEGDLFLDLEGDPFALDVGMDYLFGILEPANAGPDGLPAYHAYWSKGSADSFSLEGERAAFERAVDLIMERWRDDPDLHVYHYAPYEPSAFKRLMGRYGTREEDVDRLLRGGVFVDLYRVVRQSLRASVESYSIKKLEEMYGFQRTVELRDAGSSIAEFEEFLELSESARPAENQLENIRLYNRDDVLSTFYLRDWLEKLRADLVASGIEVPRPTPSDPEPPEHLNEQLQLVEGLANRLASDVSLDPAERTREQHARWLLAQLLSWHRREDKSTWWQYFNLMGMSEEERIDAREPIGGLEYVGVVGEVRKSLIHRYRFPDQDHAIKVGSQPHDPSTGKDAGEVHAINEADRTIDLVRGKTSDKPHPVSLIPLDYVGSKDILMSLIRLGSWVAEHGIEADGPSQAARSLILRRPPRLSCATETHGSALQHPGEESIEAACRIVLAMEQSVLPIQGPPGAGKTYTGGHMIAALLKLGKKVGITANSHKVIENLLKSVCETAQKQGVHVRAIQRAGNDSSGYEHPSVRQAKKPDDVVAALAMGDVNLVAGTAWLWSRPEMMSSVDVLFIDESGQMSLANAVAVAPAAASLVLLGDPQQLDQPLKGVHPPGADASALGHLLEGHDTIPPDRGLFLGTTWRLHPKVCDYTSLAFYDSKLLSRDGLDRQSITSNDLSGAGLWLWPVEHTGNTTESEEEARVVAELTRDLVEGPGTWVDDQGEQHKLGWNDVLIVAPYNAQVGMIQRLLPPEARVGTVDKFQGQEAPVSIYSMASSTPQDAPRGMDFLYSRNRLNVASSRARCATILVCSPALLHVHARTPQQMRLANALCQFTEMAEQGGVHEVPV